MEVVRKQPQHGWIEVIAGSMFSGKSEELIRRLRRAQIARQKVQIFKPLIDDRFSEDHIVSHSDMRIASENVKNSDELIRQVRRRHRGRRHRRRTVLRREPPGGLQHARERGQTRDRRGTRSGLPRPAVRTDAAAAGDRGVHHQDARDLRRLRRSGQPHAATRREQRSRARRRRRACTKPAAATVSIPPSHRSSVRLEPDFIPRRRAAPHPARVFVRFSRGPHRPRHRHAAGARRRISCRECAARARARPVSATAARCPADLDRPAAAVLRAHPRAWCGHRPSRRVQDPRRASPGVRRSHDVRVLRLSRAADPAHRSRVLRGWHLGRLDALFRTTRSAASAGGRASTAVSLIVISRLRNLARRLAVPLEHYGAARRLLRDKIGEHQIHFFGTGLDLGVHDERDEA